MVKEQNTWKNLGDVNFLTYGGCLVRRSHTDEELKRYPSLSTLYTVIQLMPSDDHEDMVFVGICEVDIEDYTEDTGVLSYADISGKILEEILEKESAEQFAADIISYYGIGNLAGQSASMMYPASPEDWLCSREHAKEWLESMGWKEEEETVCQ